MTQLHTRSGGRRLRHLSGMAALAVVAAIFALPAAPAHAYGAGTYAYVTNSIPNQDSVVILDTATGSAVANVPVGSYPDAVAVSANGLRAYVANDDDATISVIDATQEAVVDTLTLPTTASRAPGPTDLTLSPDGTRLYVLDWNNAELLVVDLASGSVTATVPVGERPSSVVATASRVYVANYDDSTVSVIDASTNTTVDTIPVSDGPTGLALVPAAGLLYVAGNDLGDVTVIDTSSDTVTDTIPAPGAYQAAVSPDGSRVYVSVTDGILVLDSATGTQITTIDTGGGTFGDVAVGPDGRIYDQTSQQNVATLNAYDPATFAQVQTSSFAAISNSVTIGTIAPAPVKKADVRASIAGPSAGKRNTTYTYTETVRNAGPAAAARVAATMILPRGATLVSASGSHTRFRQLVVWRTVPSMAVNATSSYTVKVRFAGTGTQLVTAVAASLSTPDPNLFNNLALTRTSIR